MHDFLFEFATNNSDIAQVLQIGNSYEERPFYAVRVSWCKEININIWFPGSHKPRDLFRRRYKMSMAPVTNAWSFSMNINISSHEEDLFANLRLQDFL